MNGGMKFMFQKTYFEHIFGKIIDIDETTIALFFILVRCTKVQSNSIFTVVQYIYGGGTNGSIHYNSKNGPRNQTMKSIHENK